MNGAEIARRVDHLSPDTRVIYMSGFTDDKLIDHGLRPQSIILLEKPFSPTQLLRTVRDVLDDVESSSLNADSRSPD
jgi:DNA-binding NarL/FixJ family response regulator